MGSATRLVVAGAGGWLAIRAGVGLTGLFGVMAVALVAFGSIVGGAILLGAWGAGTGRRAPLPSAMASSR